MSPILRGERKNAPKWETVRSWVLCCHWYLACEREEEWTKATRPVPPPDFEAPLSSWWELWRRANRPAGARERRSAVPSSVPSTVVAEPVRTDRPPEEEDRGSGDAAMPPAGDAGRRQGSSDWALLARRAAFLDFYDGELPRLIRFALLNGADLQQARMLADGALLEAWGLRHDPQRHEKAADISLWLRSRILETDRRLAVDRRALPAAPGLGARTRRMHALITALPERARAIAAFRVEGVPAEDIAERLGTGPRAVAAEWDGILSSLARELETGDEPLETVIAASGEELLDYAGTAPGSTTVLLTLIDEDQGDIAADMLLRRQRSLDDRARDTTAVITMRGQVRGIHSSLKYAESSVESFIRTVRNALRYDLDLERNYDIVNLHGRALNRRIEAARKQAEGLLRQDAAHHRKLSLLHALGEPLTIAWHLDPDRSPVLKLAIDIRPVLENHLELARRLQGELERALFLARSLLQQLAEIPVNAVGADLSELPDVDLEALAGVIWSDDTLWPAGVRELVGRHSDALWRAGLRQVQGGIPPARLPTWLIEAIDRPLPPVRTADGAGLRTPEEHRSPRHGPGSPG
ncbi:hypothetical protein [Spirillospora sp. NPDC029432]|uniref:hypothetical protein n=1 Tax=Spirillospora sp. NPDC029432 TaxID=3154599 RepID=UPI003455632D